MYSDDSAHPGRICGSGLSVPVQWPQSGDWISHALYGLCRVFRVMVSLFASGRKRRRGSDAEEGDSAPASRASKETSHDELEEAGEDDSASTATFESLGLASWVLKACSSMGFRRPTPVQARCIPSILEGRDVMGCAETGSGKTAAFALPMLHRLSEDPYGVFGVVLTPTRELAIQIAEQYQALGAAINLRHTVIIGGMSMVGRFSEHG